MDPRSLLKQEIDPASVSWSKPKPMEGLHEIGPPPFLTKTYEMIDDFSTNSVVSWNRTTGQSFVVWDANAFSTTVLPKYFKHNNFSSFARQLNTYGFRKVDPDRWEFANESFLRGQKLLLKNIIRRNIQPLAVTQQPIGTYLEACQYVPNVKTDWLRHDKQVLMAELFKLRQQQQNTRVYLHDMDLRLQGTERNQQQTMNSLAKEMQNPGFYGQLIQNKEKSKEIKEATNKKRQRPIEGGESSKVIDLVKVENLEFGDGYGFEVSELEELALEMQGFGRGKREEEKYEQEMQPFGNFCKELDAGFWEALNEGFDKEADLNNKNEDDEDINIVSCRFE